MTTVYGKLNNLLTAANATTGESDTTLTDAVQTLIDGYGQGGGGWTTDGIAQKTEPNGAITISSAVGTIQTRAFFEYQGITEVTIEGDPYIGNNAFQNCRNIETLNTPNLTKFKSGYYNSSTYTFQGCSKLKGVVFPSYAANSVIDSYVFQNCTALTYADFKDVNKIGGADVFTNTGLNVLVIRRTSGVATLQSTNNFNSSPFAINGTGGTLYVPSALISSYQSATNWSTLLGYTNNQILPIEGSYYETHYADGTVIE
ncbi:MAG: leucine-rich repeat protein [Prevotella sp.]|nr:leucine-rich repeat protein [Prevotella sp.]